MQKILVGLTALAISFGAYAEDGPLDWVRDEVRAGTRDLDKDETDACGALLCLASGKRPSECNPYLRRYFSITHKRPDKQIEKRLDFLDMCPAKQNEDNNMRSLTRAIAHGAGLCDVESLNTNNRKLVEVCNNSGEGYTCGYRTVVSDTRSPYCPDYYNHPYTYWDDTLPVYVGVPEYGGRWVEQKDYDKALAAYNAAHQPPPGMRWVPWGTDYSTTWAPNWTY